MAENDKSAAATGSPLSSWPELENFSLVLGGPLYQSLRKVRLEEDVEDHLWRRMTVISGVIWLPLLLFCLTEGTLLGGIPVPFIADVETHVRFLFVVPLMIGAELIVHRRIRGIVAQFIERRLVPEAATERFRAAIQSAIRLRNSIPAELVMIAIIYPLGYYLRGDVLALESSTWFAQIENGEATMTLAGHWFMWVSNPFTQFLFLRWYYRLFIWGHFLWQVSRIELALIPLHPDRNGGLGFLGGSAYALSPLVTAHGAALAGFIANSIFHSGTSLPDFKLEILILVVFLLVIVLLPLCVFAPQILAARRQGQREFGKLAVEYTREFDRRWLRSPDRDGEKLLGAADIQSLADLGNAFSVIKEMRGLPFGRDTFIQLILAALVPFAPLLLTMMPVEALVDRIFGAVF